MAEEGMRKTPNKLIHIGNPIPFDYQQFLVQLHHLMLAAYENQPNIRSLVEEIVTTYHPVHNGSRKKEKRYTESYENVAVTKAE